MPDDAPELAGSLVGSMLGVEQANPKPTSKEKADHPLCAALTAAAVHSVGSEHWTADIIDTVRDWLVPDTDPPSGDDWPDLHYRMRYWERDQELRDRLTDQARIARGEQ